MLRLKNQDVLTPLEDVEERSQALGRASESCGSTAQRIEYEFAIEMNDRRPEREDYALSIWPRKAFTNSIFAPRKLSVLGIHEILLNNRFVSAWVGPRIPLCESA